MQKRVRALSSRIMGGFDRGKPFFKKAVTKVVILYKNRLSLKYQQKMRDFDKNRQIIQNIHSKLSCKIYALQFSF